MRDEQPIAVDALRLSAAGLTDASVSAVVDAAPDGIIVADAAGHILLANRQTEVLFRYPRGDLLGHSVDDLLPEPLSEVHRAHRTRYRAEPRTRAMGAGLHLFGRRSDGSVFPVEISLSPLGTDGGLRVVAVIRDITERIETEERLRQAEQDLRVVEERERIARDLHDIVIQKLFAAGMTIQSVLSRSTEPDQARRLSSVVDDLDDTIREIRSVIFGLQSNRHGDGVRGEILRIASEERLVLGFEPRVRFEGPVDTISERIATALLATLREALSNVARHAEAAAVEIIVECGESVTLRVLDDGRGIPQTVTGGNGILNLTERATMLGGGCRVAAGADGGTTLEWQVPNSPR